MKRTLFAVLILLLVHLGSNSQTVNLRLNSNRSSEAGSGLVMPYIFYAAAFINPMIVFEDKKVFFGLTKEITFGKFPYGRISFEYSYIFRSYNTSHLRFSYNYDIILEAGDFVAFTASPGLGYFTDTRNKGWFAQGSVGAILPFGGFIAAAPYLRYRHTFIKEKLKTDIDDVSLGMAFMIYF